MSLDWENAAFNNPEPEVESFLALEKYFTDLDSERKRKRVPSESRSAIVISYQGQKRNVFLTGSFFTKNITEGNFSAQEQGRQPELESRKIIPR